MGCVMQNVVDGIYYKKVNGMTYQRVKFVTLTMKNGTSEERQLSAYGRFFKSLSFRTKCHVYYDWGIEEGYNSHAHFSVSVPSCEIDLWNKRIKKFRWYNHWSGLKGQFKDYEPFRRTDSYVSHKHKDMGFDHICPKVWACKSLEVCRFGARNIY